MLNNRIYRNSLKDCSNEYIEREIRILEKRLNDVKDDWFYEAIYEDRIEICKVILARRKIKEEYDKNPNHIKEFIV